MFLDQLITVIIPALNEQEAVGKVIRELPEFIDQIIVVDNGSIDQTSRVAREAGAAVIYESKKGYGSACQAGIAAIQETDIVAFMDGDYSDYPGEIIQLIEPVARGAAALAIGSRKNSRSSLPNHQQWGNKFACYLIRLLHGYSFEDLGPMRCLRYELLKDINMSDPDFGWTAEMQLKVSAMGQKIIQIPVNYRNRIGTSKISGTVKGSILAGYKILWWTVRLYLNPKVINFG